MASQILIISLIFFAVVGLASAAADAPTANDSDDDFIGNVDGDFDAAPVGGPVPNGVFTTTTGPAPSPKGGAAALEVSAAAGVVAAIAAVFF
ncbi:anther-specific protein BCP1-like [Rhododendron vialii]|uniref:anther-specific protein BCP1-like n=1 Tax=Rhododendron vialii TaxID=182163 RepID=UPI00265F7A26|nr:anther-specific protein BCP1-like [Rhododendron vialii]